MPFTAAGLYIKQSLSWNDSRSGGIEMSDGKSGAGDVNAIKYAYLRILWRMDLFLAHDMKIKAEDDSLL